MGDPAVFLDRDGVLIDLVWDETRSVHAAPLRSDSVRLQEGVSDGLRTLRSLGYVLVLVSNQPDAATGRTTIEGLWAVHNRFAALLSLSGVPLDDYRYCYHHPEGEGELGIGCICRKPLPGLILSAAEDHDIDLNRSWMVGDRDKDIEAGKAATLRTIQIFPALALGAAPYRLACPDGVAASLADAANLIAMLDRDMLGTG